ncbi:cation:proton antiporter [Chitinophaga sp. CB10]|uniref:cation:proton antiporter n=1 Tax=Chitinophaga sp. CB10 TaxID=1891659 RepID=UPI000B257D2C|nr:cation:proton antiporter [Chitinophaga sp. CB10]
MNKRFVWYPVIIGIFGAIIWFILHKGQALPVKQAAVEHTMHTPTPLTHPDTWLQYLDNFRHPLSLLLLQIVVIMVVARLFGRLAKKVRQPSVVGEIIAGVLLGPSLLGWLTPSFSGFLFPAESLKSLQFLSQIGLAFFMFIVGMELDMSKVRNKAHDAVMISHASIVVPFALGVGLAYFIFESFAPANVSFLAFALFMGIAMSITAFPVLARIVQERKLTGTPLGTLAITCAAADDITAWCILAVVVAIAKASGLASAIITIALALLFVTVMILLVRPWLHKVLKRHLDNHNEKVAAGYVFLTLLISAWVAEVIGIHALFGAFLAGAVMPVQDTVRKLFTDKLEDVSVMVLLPIFFAFTGLRTQIGLLSQGHLWAAFGLIMLVAVGGKFGGSAVTARLMGQTWRQSVSIGALMNTRGLMELIVLNIGYDLGILSPEIFAMLVLMALATTFMTGPVLDLVDFSGKKAHRAATA